MRGTRVELAISYGRARITRDGAHLAADPAARDRAVEIERAGQMWSLSRPGKEG
jgi:hypothetical protein